MKTSKSRLAAEIESCEPSGEQTPESRKSLADTTEALVVAADDLVAFYDATWNGTMTPNEAFNGLMKQVEALRVAKNATLWWTP